MDILKDDLHFHVNDVYQHLYDVIYLRSSILTDLLIPDKTIQKKEKAWKLHHLMIDLIEELDPGQQAPPLSRERRRHQLMVQRYIDGLDPQKVANLLAISRRQYYREHDLAIEAISKIIQERFLVNVNNKLQKDHQPEETARNTIEILKSETSRINTGRSSVNPAEVIGRILPLLEEMLHKKESRIITEFPDNLPAIQVNTNLLRQLLLGLISFIIQETTHATIRIPMAVEPERISVSILSEQLRLSAVEVSQSDSLTALDEMAKLGQLEINLEEQAGRILGFDIYLPYGKRTILVVDDNEDVVELIKRYLEAHRFDVLTASSAQAALSVLEFVKPDAITLDLMMPGRDGWDLMQTILNQKDTYMTPIVVCSVLKQRELAFSLGAAGFVEKPIQEHVLVMELESLIG